MWIDNSWLDLDCWGDLEDIAGPGKFSNLDAKSELGGWWEIYIGD